MGVGSGSLTVSDRKQSRLHCLLYKNIVKLLENGGGNWRFGFCFYICKVKTALGTYPIWQRCIYMHAEQRKLEKLTSRMFLGWVCREARPLFL